MKSGLTADQHPSLCARVQEEKKKKAGATFPSLPSTATGTERARVSAAPTSKSHALAANALRAFLPCRVFREATDLVRKPRKRMERFVTNKIRKKAASASKLLEPEPEPSGLGHQVASRGSRICRAIWVRWPAMLCLRKLSVHVLGSPLRKVPV